MNVDKIRSANGFMRSVASIVLVTYSALVFSPAVHAMEQVRAQRAAIAQGNEDARFNLGLSLTRSKDMLRVMAERPDAWKRKTSSSERRAAKEALRASRDDTRRLIEEVRSEFAATATRLKSKKVPEVIRRRQADTVARFEREVAGFNKDLDDALAAADEETQKSKAESALKRLERHKLGRSQQAFDPKNLPNTVLKPDRTRMPKTSVEAFQAALLTGESSVRLAQTSGFDFSHLPGADNPTYLEATTEVVLSDDIKAKAAELHNNPVEIYNWVRNNVQWQPTWGAIQDASLTLSARRGNASDIASLTVALLRASGIPARYVYGTIDVPEDKFRNWAGGFQNIDAAMDFASAGGIPLGAVTSGGHITKVRMEHIWVEAAVDFIPSRGAKNRSADSWTAMDPSFKQVEVLQGLDAVQIAGIDPAQLSHDLFASGTVNETEGWLTGLNPAVLQNAQMQALTGLETYVRNLPNATVGDVLGGRRIVAHASPTLAATLPNKVVAEGARFAKLPAALKQQITFAFGKDIEGYPIDPHTFAWAQLNNRDITLSFRPAAQADEDALRALIPAGGISTPSQVPSSIPAYLIHVIPELKVDGAAVMTGTPVTLGQDVTFEFDPIFAGRGARSFSYALPAGSFLAIAAIAGSVKPGELQSTSARMSQTQATLATHDLNQISGMGAERLMGDAFHSGLLDYYAYYVGMGGLTGLKSGGHYALAAGLGSFGYEPRVDTFFGIPRSIQPGGVAMNIPIVNIVRHDGSDAAGRQFTTQLGGLSSILEHSIPEQLFSEVNVSAQGVSAVKAIIAAGNAGQRIYEITSQNSSTVLPMIHHDAATMNEIQSAIAAGKTVLTHTGPISISGWTGAGYVLLDPETGAGAWKISGGSNGGFLKLIDENAAPLGLIAFGISALPELGLLPIFGFLGLAIAVAVTAASLVVFLDELDGGPCDPGLLALYATLIPFFLIAGFLAGGVLAGALAMFIFGVIGDGAIRTAAKSKLCTVG
jgi:hypothetical protein